MQPKISNGLIIFIVVGVIIFLSAIGGFIYVLNLTNEISVVRQQKENELKIAIEKIRNLPKLKEDLAVLEAEETRLATFIPNKEGQAEFVWQLEELASQSKIDITSCSIEKESKGYKDLPGFIVYQWKVKIEGDYEGLIRFLEILPQAKRGVLASDLKINSIFGDETDKDDYKLQVEMILDLITSSGEKVNQ